MRFFKHIIVGTDLTPGAEWSIQQAIALAEHHTARLSILHSIDTQMSQYRSMLPLSPSDLEEMLRQETKRKILKMYADSPKQKQIDFSAHARMGKPYKELIRYAEAEGGDLILIGPRNPSLLKRIFLGSTAGQLLRNSPLPTLLMHPEKNVSFKRILAPVDCSESSRQALQKAAALARHEGAELHILNVLEETPITSLSGLLPIAEVSGFHALYKQDNQETMERFLAQCPELSQVDCKQHFKEGLADQEIQACAQEVHADLIVMGTAGRTGVSGIVVGNTAERVARSLNCSMLTLPIQTVPNMRPLLHEESPSI